MFKKVALGSLVVIFLGLGTFWSLNLVNQVEADTTAGLSGWAWSSNVGWISLDCHNTGTNKCATSNYQVEMDKTTNDLSGYGWSPNVGWINFGPTGPYPTGTGVGNFSARFDPVTKKLVGWVRAVAYGGGWDGWVSLSGAAPSSSYGITLGTDNKFSGFSWGGEVLGWISLAYASCADCVTNLPQVDNILTVAIAGTGSGKVAGASGAINCGTGTPNDCTENYHQTAPEVVLVATPSAGSTFNGWSGTTCTGTFCTLTVDQSKTVTATFNTIVEPPCTGPGCDGGPGGGDPSGPTTHTLTVTVIGSGKVTGSGIDCNIGNTGDCTETSELALFALTATPVAGTTFIGWSDSANSSITGCREICVIPLDQSKTVTATFSTVTPPEVIKPVIFGACTRVGGLCLVQIDCVTSACRANEVFSNGLLVTPPVTEGDPTPIDIYFGNSAGVETSFDNFKLYKCDVGGGNCLPLTGAVSDSNPFIIKVKELVDSTTVQSSFNTYLHFKNGASDSPKAIFRFITSNAGQN